MNISKIALLFLVGVWPLATQAQQTPSIVPFEPTQLLKVLPTAPEGWKTLRSEGDTRLGDWLESRALRTLQAPPTPPSATEPSPPAPGEIEISILDTAAFAPALAAFANFTPNKTGNFEKKLIGALPAIVITNEDGRLFTQVLVSSRYIVELTLTNLPKQRAEEWLRGFHFETLPPQSKTLTVRPREFRLTHFDELDAKKNRSYAVSTTSSRRVDAFLKTLPPSPPEPASPVTETAANK